MQHIARLTISAIQKIVTIGEEVYSSYFDTERPLNVSISASDIDLENNVSYKVICIVSMILD